MKSAMIVAPQPEAVEAGALALRDGGNAVDAAITCALVQGVVDPFMCGIAGFGSLQVYLPSRGVHHCIDFHGRAPAAVRADMWQDLIEGETRDGFGFILKGQVNDIGYQAITVPGSLMAYHQAQSEFGSFDWQRVVAPALAIAEAGFIVRPHVHHWWTHSDDLGRAPVIDRLRFSATGRQSFIAEDGEPLRPGMRLRNPDLARTLRRISEGGIEVFYRGAIAREIDSDMKRNGGLLSAEDLAGYDTTRGDPLWSSYRGHRLATNQPPGGGPMLAEMLNILECFDLAALGHNSPEYMRVVVEAMKRATADKDAHIGDPAFVDVPLDRLMSKDYAQTAARDIRDGKKAHVTRYQAGQESPDTTHISVIDGAGNAVSMTHSLGMPSGVISDGLGFMYNGCMGVFDPRPGHADSLAPGKSRFSSICPSILFDGDTPFLVIGAPGGTQIAMGVLQAILNVVDFGMTATEAVSAPRFSATSDIIDISNRIPGYVTDVLAGQGYEIARSPESYTFASVHAILARDGRLDGAADPNHDGMALEVRPEI